MLSSGIGDVSYGVDCCWLAHTHTSSPSDFRPTLYIVGARSVLRAGAPLHLLQQLNSQTKTHKQTTGTYLGTDYLTMNPCMVHLCGCEHAEN